MSTDSPSPPIGGADSDDCLAPDVAAALTAMDAAVDVLGRLDLTLLDGRQAAVVAGRLGSVTSRAAVTRVRMLPVIDADGLWALSGARSFPVWVSHAHHVAIHTARAKVRMGRTLRDHLPTTAAAAAAGHLTAEQAQVLATLAPITQQRRDLLAEPGQECDEAFLVAQARHLSVDETRVLARQWAAYADPDADDRGYVESCDREHLDIARLGAGYHLEGQLTLEHGQTLKAALEALTPARATDDDRTSTQRRAQALADLAHVTLTNGLAGTGRAVRPRVTVLVDEPTFRARAQAAVTAPARGTRQGEQLGGDEPRSEPGAGPSRTPPMLTADMLTGDAIAGGP